MTTRERKLWSLSAQSATSCTIEFLLNIVMKSEYLWNRSALTRNKKVWEWLIVRARNDEMACVIWGESDNWVWTHLVTHLVWPHQQDNPTREAQGLADQSMKKPILVFLNLSHPIFESVELVVPTVWWSSMFHLLTTLLEKKYFLQSRVHLCSIRSLISILNDADFDTTATCSGW